jgi:hypothetical protein
VIAGGVFNDSVTTRWQRGELSNFAYLMHLNTMAGRSFTDLSQVCARVLVVVVMCTMYRVMRDVTQRTLTIACSTLYSRGFSQTTRRRRSISPTRPRFAICRSRWVRRARRDWCVCVCVHA